MGKYKYEKYILKHQKDFFIVVKARVSTLLQYCAFTGLRKEFLKKNSLGLSKEKKLLLYTPAIYLNGNIYHSKKSWILLEHWILKDPLRIGKKLLDIEEKLVANFIKKSEDLNNITFIPKTKKEIKFFLEDYFAALLKAFALIDVSIILDKIISRVLTGELQKVFFQGADNALLMFSTPLKKSATGKKEDDIMKIASQLENYSPKEFDSALANLERKYSFLGMRFLNGKPLAKSDFEQEIKEMAKGANIKLNNQQKNEKEKKRQFQVYYQKIKSNQTKQLINFVQRLALHRTKRLDGYNKSCLSFRNFYKTKLEEKIKINYSDFIYLTIPEIYKYLAGRKIIVNQPKKRKNAYALFSLPERKINVIENIREINKYIGLMEDEIKAINEIKGNIAMKGIVKGKVRIIKEDKDFKKLKKGEILVTEMTTPDFAPIMKKASAIITDLGGITSHAAIISREIGTPCIIGTKIATRVLKDGDLVEVDAEKGIIKVLKK